MSAIQSDSPHVRHALRVRDLSAALRGQNPDAIVLLVAPVGDRWATTAALPVYGVRNLYVDQEVVAPNPFSPSNMELRAPHAGRDQDEPMNDFDAVILSSSPHK